MTAYTRAGVDLEGADRHVAAIAPLVTAGWGPNVVGGFGGFAAGVELPTGYQRPVVMMSTDGMGTKLDLARRTDRWDGVGFDLVAMCVDDLAVVGAEPLGFVDYMAVGSLHPDRDTRIVASIAAACASSGLPLLGGETAEHPGVMDSDAVDLAGTAVGVVEFGKVTTGASIRSGDVVLGLTSPNLRSNGFSLVRRIVAGIDLDTNFPNSTSTWAEVLLEPAVIYSHAVLAAIRTGKVKGGAHITGGGIAGNLIRCLPRSCGASVTKSNWEVPPVFSVLAEVGQIDQDSMFSAFNMGIGFCLVVDEDDVDEVTVVVEGCGFRTTVIGHVGEGEHRVLIV